MRALQYISIEIGIMLGDYEQEVSQILSKLHFKSINDLLQQQSLNTDIIAQKSKLHGIVVQAYLHRLHEIALKTQLLEKKTPNLPPTQQTLIQFDKILPDLHNKIQQGELLQVLGRANGGKTHFLINCIKQALGKGMQPILLSSSWACTEQYLAEVDKDKLMVFQFEQICDLAMTIHAIGNQILQSQKWDYNTRKHIVIIDCLSQIEQQDESIQFDCSQKFRRLINTFTTRTQSSIIYTYRVNNSLFQTQFKKDHHRPKCKNSKEWDGWANKNMMIDTLTRKKDGKVVVRVAFPKGIDNKVYQVML